MSTENPAEAQLVDYDEADEVTVNEAPIQEEEDADARKFAMVYISYGARGHYVGMNTSGFKDFYLKDAIMQAISYCGFEHPSEGILR